MTNLEQLQKENTNLKNKLQTSENKNIVLQTENKHL